jgi:hypothetical protein
LPPDGQQNYCHCHSDQAFFILASGSLCSVISMPEPWLISLK